MLPINSAKRLLQDEAPAAARFSPNDELIVESKTLGTSISYNLFAVNVSKSGFLLTWTRDTAVPFNVNTILEMRIDPYNEWFDRSVTCLGKVVRRDDQTLKRPKFGVKIVQIDEEEMGGWQQCLEYLEKKAKGLLTSEEEFVPPKSPVRRPA